MTDEPSLREMVAKAIRDTEDPDEYISEFYAHADAALKAIATRYAIVAALDDRTTTELMHDRDSK